VCVKLKNENNYFFFMCDNVKQQHIQKTPMQYVPKDVAFAVAALPDYNKNTFRLEAGSATASPNSIITITLPSNATIDLRSFAVHLDLETTQVGDVYGKLPADVSSLVSHMEIFASGVQLSSCSEFNTVSRIRKLCTSSRDREGSIDSTLSHGIISSTDAVEQVSCIFKPSVGLFAESSTRYLPTSIVGDISVRITLSGASCLCYKELGVPMSNTFSAAGKASAASVTYRAQNIFAVCDTVTLGSAYEAMLTDRLSREMHLSVNFKEYYTFSLHGSSGSAHDVRFSLSCSSIDRIYTVMRDSNYQTPGIRTQGYTGASLSDSMCSNGLHFKSYNDSVVAKGSLRYQYSINNIQFPQFEASILGAASELAGVANVGAGNLITSLTDFNVGKCVIPLQLCMPNQPINIKSGYNSRGSSTQFSVSLKGLTTPTEHIDSQISSTISSLVCVETTAELRIGSGRSVAISH
jgi:hypothetical protein